jgi:RsbT co-antagonist protein rsbRD N-terminal domain
VLHGFTRNQTCINRATNDKPSAVKESVSDILTRHSASVIATWLVRTKESCDLDGLQVSDAERVQHLPELMEDLCIRLGKPKLPTKDSDSPPSAAAREHGKLRSQQGYTAAMLVHESRILKVTLFGTLQEHLNTLDFHLLLPDIMIIADEVDAQLSETMTSFMEAASAKPFLTKPSKSASQAR